MRRLCLVLAWLIAGPAAAQGARLPAEAVDAFHAALRNKDTAAALSVEAYALTHLPFDMDLAVASQWKLETRRVGGEGNERWVLSTYRVTGKQADGTPIDQLTLETAILRRTAGLFRIVHFHWSTSDAGFQARSQGQRQGAPR